MLGGRYMAEEVKEMLAYGSACSLLSLIEFYLNHSDSASVLGDTRTNPFHNYQMESLYHAIQSHPLNRI